MGLGLGQSAPVGAAALGHAHLTSPQLCKPGPWESPLPLMPSPSNAFANVWLRVRPSSPWPPQAVPVH